MTRLQELERIIQIKQQVIDYFMGILEENYPETHYILAQIRRSRDEISKCEHERHKLVTMGIA